MTPMETNAASFPSPAQPPVPAPGWPRAPRALSAGRGIEWWKEGWRIFLAAPMLWIGIVVVLVIIVMVVGFVPLLGQLAQAVLWPLFLGGLFLGCYAMARGSKLSFEYLFAGFKDGHAGGLVILGLIALAAGFLVLLVLGMFVFGAVGVSGLTGMLSGDPTAAMGTALAGAGVAALIAAPIVIVATILFMMAWWFATPLVVLNRAPAFEALATSFDAAWKNLGALVVFVLVYFVLAIVATIPFGLGWLVLGPVAVGASFASWREVFGE
jgi:uncharacterized membrane protein